MARTIAKTWSCAPSANPGSSTSSPSHTGTWGPALGIIDFERGTKLTGSRFYVLSGAGARLQRALIAWMLDLHIRQGYTEQYLPFMVKTATVYGAGQLPKFADNLYKDNEEDLYFVPTAEVPLTGLHMDEILDEASLPRYYTAYTPCFRREKMSAGRDVRGIKRGHQFDKVEMYIYCKPEESEAQLENAAHRRRTDLRGARSDLPCQAALHRRCWLWCHHDLRSRSLGAGLRRMAGSLLGLERHGLPGPPRQYQVPSRPMAARPASCIP
jgi:seryl-tRNA synthetase